MWYRGLLAPATVRCHRVATQTGWRRTDKMYMFTLLGYVNFIDEIKKREERKKARISFESVLNKAATSPSLSLFSGKQKHRYTCQGQQKMQKSLWHNNAIGPYGHKRHCPETRSLLDGLSMSEMSLFFSACRWMVDGGCFSIFSFAPG